MDTKTKGILGYLVLAFGLAWALWEIPIRLGLTPERPVFQLAVLPGAFAPAVAALIVRKWITGEGFADAGLRPNLRAAWPTYLIAWLLPLPMTAVIVALAVISGLSQPDFTLMRFATHLFGETSIPSPPPSIWLLLPFQLSINALIATPILWGEEFGWRGYLQLRLFPRRPLLAAIATGLIWGAWHYPLNLRGYNYPDHLLLGLALFPIGTALLSIVFGWLRLRSGSIWAPCLAHAATNAIGGSLTMLLFMGGPNWIWASYLGVLGWLPLGVLCTWIVLTGQLQAEAVHATCRSSLLR